MALAFDFDNKIIYVPPGQTILDCYTTLRELRDAELSTEGMQHLDIASSEGFKSLVTDDNGDESTTGLTIEFNGWQIKFPDGSGKVFIKGGNMIGGVDGDIIAYAEGVQVINIQSQAATAMRMTVSTGVSASDRALLETAASESTKTRKMALNDAVIDKVAKTSTIFEDDGVTPFHVFNHPNSLERRR